MIRENDYIRAIKQQFPQLPPEREFQYRKEFRRMPNEWKKAIDQERVKNKQNVSFEEWWAIVGENVRKGKAICEQNKDVKRGTKYDNLRRELNNNNHREYLGLDPLSDEDKKEIKEQYESNVDRKYEYPSWALGLIRPEQEEEISEEALEMMDNSMENLEGAEAIDMDELQSLLEEE